jgi:hypothetical protein
MVRILRADTLGLVLYAVQIAAVAIALGLVFHRVTGSRGETVRNVGFVLTIAGFWFGFVHAAGELVRERPLHLRERAFGLRPSSYVLSKWLVLLPLALLPVALLYLYACLVVRPLGGVSVLPLATLLLVTATGTCAGLAFSGLLREPRWMVAGLFVTMMLQIIWSGIFRLPAAGAARWGARLLSAQYWAWEAFVRFSGFRGPDRSRVSPEACLLALLAMAAATALLTYVLLRRRRP